MTKPLCIYHGNCADGFGAAWAVRKALGEIEFHAGIYGDAAPDVTGRKVIMVDFSYRRYVLEAMAQQAESILILDHHKTAAEDLAGYPRPPAPLSPEHRGWLPDKGIWAEFDMSRSGATMAWDHFHPGPRPALINTIEDRDLWKFALWKTREIQAAVFSYPYDFAVWDRLVLDMTGEELAAEGVAIERKHFKDIAELVAVSKRPMKIGGHVVPVANLPYTLTSDAGNLMAEGQPFAACYMDTPRGRVFSLRSKADGLDVSEIAKIYGGGGHKNAAGFTVPFHRLSEFEP